MAGPRRGRTTTTTTTTEMSWGIYTIYDAANKMQKTDMSK